MDYDQKNQLEVFNLGSSKGYSVLEIIHTFNNELGKEIPFQFSGRRKGDVEIITADITLAKNKLNWTPKYKLEDMVKVLLIGLKFSQNISLAYEDHSNRWFRFYWQFNVKVVIRIW